MKGQLWQECRCGTEPVCVDCERCEKHCRCDADAAALKAFDQANPGLRQRLAEHHEQGSREH